MSSTSEVSRREDRNDDFWYQFGYDALDLTVETYALDGIEGTHGLTGGSLTLDDVAWDTLTISGVIDVDTGLGDFVFEDGVDPSEAGRLLVLGDCIKTHNRFVVAEISNFSEGSVQFSSEISRDDVAESLELRPVLVRDSPGTTEEYLYGQVSGLKLADGDPFEIDLDGDDDGTFLPIETKPFDEDREGRLFYLDHSVASDPELYINSEINLLVNVLKSRAPHGPKRWTREVLERLIGQPVWVELVLWTAADIQDGECQYGWQEDVVGALAEVRDESPDDVAEELERHMEEPDRVDTLVETTNGDAQDILGIDGPLEDLLEEIL